MTTGWRGTFCSGALVVPASYDEDGVPGVDKIDDGVEGGIFFYVAGGGGEGGDGDYI